MEDGIAEFFVAAARHIREPLQQRLRLSRHQLWNDFVVQPGEEIGITGEITAVEQRDSELDIRGIEAVALLQGASSGTHLQTQVPYALRKASDPIFENLLGLTVSVKEKQINIRIGKQPIAPESSQRNQGEIPWTSLFRTDD